MSALVQSRRFSSVSGEDELFDGGREIIVNLRWVPCCSSDVQEGPVTPSSKEPNKDRPLLGTPLRYLCSRSGGGTALLPCEDYPRVPMMRPALACRPLLIGSHNAPTNHGAGQKCRMLQRVGNRLDCILVPQPNRRSSLPYAISYRGNLVSASAMSSSVGVSY
jgi:hypothetical protein